MSTPCSFKHVCNKFGSDGCSASVLLVLTGIWEARHHSCYSSRRCHLTRTYSDQKFHEHIVHRLWGCLKDENISFPNGSLYRHEGFTIGEPSAAKCLRAYGVAYSTSDWGVNDVQCEDEWHYLADTNSANSVWLLPTVDQHQSLTS